MVKPITVRINVYRYTYWNTIPRDSTQSRFLRLPSVDLSICVCTGECILKQNNVEDRKLQQCLCKKFYIERIFLENYLKQ